jgi:hypothetical protein
MRLISFALLLLLLGQTGSPPAPIHTAYDESLESTEIKTNWLYVSNNPDQFLQLKLVGRFPGKQMPKTGPKIFEVEIISQAPQHRYVGLPELVAIADGVELKIGKMDQHPIQAIMGMFKGGQKGSESLVNRTVSPVPATAAVLAQHKAEDLVGEWIVTTISRKQLTTLAQASKIDWKLGSTEFSFNEIQLTRVKQFLAAVTPEGGAVATEPDTENVPEEKSEKPMRTDTPSDANNSTLKETLDWLKKQISKYATKTSETGEPGTLTLTKFNSCNIEWRLAPPVALEAPGGRSNTQDLPHTLYYVVNLKDLEPGSVEVTKSGDWLRFSTRNHDQVIKLIYKDTQTGNDEYTTPRLLNSAFFELKQNDLGGEMRAALSHAIKLCQASPTK